MPRIAGIDIPEKKKLTFALRYIYGVGPTNVIDVLAKAGVDPEKRTSELSADEINKLQKVVDAMMVEGDLRKNIAQNIGRLKSIGAYRGVRHTKGLPSRGQRTRTNARTKRGKRVTIGALKKEQLAKVEASKAASAKKEAPAAKK